jgi:RecA-family ATPase
MTGHLPILNAARENLPEDPTWQDIRRVVHACDGGDSLLHSYLIEELLRLYPKALAEFEEGTSRFHSIDWKAMSSREQDAHWLLEPVLPKGRLIALFASGKAGKSLLALDMALALATGRSILKQPAGDPMSVMYIDQEMTPNYLAERASNLGYDTDEDDLSHLHYYQLQGFAPFDTPEGGEQLLRLVEIDKPVFVIIDTTARVVAGPENDVDTYRNLYRETLQHLKAMDVTVLRIDHGGKKPPKGREGPLQRTTTSTSYGYRKRRATVSPFTLTGRGSAGCHRRSR